MKNVIIVNNPLVADSLTHLRQQNTGVEKFRRHSNKICQLLFATAVDGLHFKSSKIQTPLASMNSPKFAEEVVIVPVLRSGLAMLFGALELLPKAKVGFVGMQRDEKTAVASEYYWKLPKISAETVVMVTDPMLATGGSLLYLLRRVSSEAPKEMRVVCVVAAPEGIKKIHSEFPNVKIFTAAVDDKLNAQKYIVPGLGDYGDRYFATND